MKPEAGKEVKTVEHSPDNAGHIKVKKGREDKRPCSRPGTCGLGGRPLGKLPCDR